MRPVTIADGKVRELNPVEWTVIEGRLNEMLAEAVVAINEESKMSLASIKGLGGVINQLDDIKKEAAEAATGYQDSLGHLRQSVKNLKRFTGEVKKASSEINAAIGQHINLEPEEEPVKEEPKA